MSQQLPISPQKLIADYLHLLRHSPIAPNVVGIPVSEVLPVRDASRPCALLLSPHPDDECLTGVLPLRLRHKGWQVINIAITLGSKIERRSKRLIELAQACAVLGFDCALPQVGGFENINAETRDSDALKWHKYVARLAAIISHCKPLAVFMPHMHDAHPTHRGTHFLGMDALAKQPSDFSCSVFQTEYWHPIADPNLIVGVSQEDAAMLLSALACHVGEVARNPYDSRFSAFLIDNVRRGSERIGGKGVATVPMDFAMLYDFGAWQNGKFVPSALKRTINDADSIQGLIELV